MGIFKNQTTENIEDSGDTLGGGFQPVPSDVYDAVIKLAYVGKSRSSDSQSVTLHLEVDGKEVRETIYVTNRDGENFYKDKKDPKKKHFLPGWSTIDDICLFVTGEGLTEAATEPKTVKLYDFDARAETNQEVPVLVDIIGKPIKVGILRQIEDKQKMNESSGKYENTGETRTVNVIDKVFHPETGRTVTEYRQEVDPGEFMDAWLERNKGQDRNRAKGTAAGGPGAGGVGRPGGAKKSAKENIFG